MDMSRFPVCEAFVSLECEELVTIELYKGTFISIPDSTESVKTYEIRDLLEVHALTPAIRGDADIEPSREDFLRDDFEFYEMLCKLSGNSVLYRT